MKNYSINIGIFAKSNMSAVASAFSSSVNKMSKSLGNFNAIADKNQAAMGHLGSAADKAGRAITVGLTATLAAATFQGSKYETALLDLSALTGLTGETLADMGHAALDSSKKFGLSGARILETNKIIASSIPALLKQPVLLGKVTDAALLLGKASRMDLADSTRSLTTTLNQFNLEGQDSLRVVNALAAGSKEGAADIPYLSDAIEKAGTTFSLMGISIEQGVAIVETIAPKFKQASLAGNTLDKSFLKMRESGMGMTDGVFNLNDALDEVRVQIAEGTSVAETFGVEHAKVIEVLLQSGKEFDRYTKAVTGTDIAFEQADVNMGSLAEKTKRLGAAVNSYLIKLFEKLKPLLSKVVSVLTKLFDHMEKGTVLGKLFTGAILLVVGALSLMIVQYKIWKAIQVAKLIWPVVKAIWAMNTAWLANPVGLVIAAIVIVIALVTTAIVKWDEWGAALTLFMGPIGWIVNMVMNLKDHWSDIIRSFKEGGMIGMMKEMGKVLFDLILKPTMQLMGLLAKLPKIGKYFKGAQISIAATRAEMFPENEKTMNDLNEATSKPPLSSSQQLDVNMKIDSEGRPTIEEVKSDGGLTFGADLGHTTAFAGV